MRYFHGGVGAGPRKRSSCGITMNYLLILYNGKWSWSSDVLSPLLQLFHKILTKEFSRLASQVMVLDVARMLLMQRFQALWLALAVLVCCDETKLVRRVGPEGPRADSSQTTWVLRHGLSELQVYSWKQSMPTPPCWCLESAGLCLLLLVTQRISLSDSNREAKFRDDSTVVKLKPSSLKQMQFMSYVSTIIVHSATLTSRTSLLLAWRAIELSVYYPKGPILSLYW